VQHVEAGSEDGVVARGDEVNGAAHQHAPREGAAPQGPLEALAAEALESAPQPDVGRRRPLRLQARDPLDRLHERQPGTPEPQLARERRPVQLALREDALHPSVR
jgi:hypothetical protein